MGSGDGSRARSTDDTNGSSTEGGDSEDQAAASPRVTADAGVAEAEAQTSDEAGSSRITATQLAFAGALLASVGAAGALGALDRNELAVAFAAIPFVILLVVAWWPRIGILRRFTLVVLLILSGIVLYLVAPAEKNEPEASSPNSLLPTSSYQLPASSTTTAIPSTTAPTTTTRPPIDSASETINERLGSTETGLGGSTRIGLISIYPTDAVMTFTSPLRQCRATLEVGESFAVQDYPYLSTNWYSLTLLNKSSNSVQVEIAQGSGGSPPSGGSCY